MEALNNPLIKQLIKTAMNGVSVNADQVRQVVSFTKKTKTPTGERELTTEQTYNDFIRQVVEFFGGKVL